MSFSCCCCCFSFSLYISILQIFCCSLFLWFSTHLISAVHCFSFARVLDIFRKSLCDKGLLNACKLLIEVKTLNGFLVDFFQKKLFGFVGIFLKRYYVKSGKFIKVGLCFEVSRKRKRLWKNHLLNRLIIKREIN